MQTSPIDQLARLVGQIHTSFDAEVLDVRDDLDGGIVVDVRLDAAKALDANRRAIRDRAWRVMAESRELLEHSEALQRKTSALMQNLRVSASSYRRSLARSRRSAGALRTRRVEIAAVRTEPSEGSADLGSA